VGVFCKRFDELDTIVTIITFTRRYILTIKDRLTRGFIAGLIAGIPMNILSYIFFRLGFTELRFVDWVYILLLERMVQPTISSHAFALITHLMFTGILGIIFAYFIKSVSTENYYFKGWLFSVTVWFLSYLGSTLFPVFKFIITSVKTPATNLVSATVFGLVLAWALKWLDHSVKVNS
jgi:hypothetical protein